MPTTSRTRKAFENKTAVTFREGKELNGWIKNEGKGIARITIQKANKDIPKGTLSAIAKGLSIDVYTLCEFVKCNIKGPELIDTILKKQKRNPCNNCINLEKCHSALWLVQSWNLHKPLRRYPGIGTGRKCRAQ